MISYYYRWLGWVDEDCVKFFMIKHTTFIRHIKTYQELRFNCAHDELKDEYKIKIRRKRTNRFINSWSLDKRVTIQETKSWKHVSKCRKQYMKKNNYKGYINPKKIKE